MAIYQENKKTIYLILFISVIALSITFSLIDRIDRINTEKWVNINKGKVTQPIIPTQSPAVNSIKNTKYNLLKKVSAEVQISYLNKLLGDPIYKNKINDNWDSYTYVDPDYYVWALVNKENKVLAYSITSRKENFNPSFRILGREISLNKAAFSDWLVNFSTNPTCYRFIGARNPIYYFEKIYLGNPGLYQTYWVGISNAGYFKNLPEVTGEEKEKLFGKINCQNVQGREKAKINTILVWAPFFEIEDKELENNPLLYFGPNYDQVRTLNE